LNPNPPAMNPPEKQDPRGFSLLEILIATAVMAVVFSYLSSAFIQGGFFLSKTPRYTQSALLVRGVVLDLEEEYRKEGFPENDLTNRRCEIPRELDDLFSCEYDMEKLDIDAGMLGEMANALIEQLTAGVSENGSMLQAFQVLAFLFIKGEIPISPLCPATPSQFLSMCQINLAAIERNIMGMASFFPQIIVQAAEQTRKLRVRISYASEKEPLLEIETYIISVPEEVAALQEEGVIPGAQDIPGSVPPPGSSKGGGTGGGSTGGR
jgi:prepilin-type N-terminal cleavage/methylation domain-containing protein